MDSGIIRKRDILINDALDALYEERDDANITNYDLFISPPDPAVLTDEDSGDEDFGGTIDNLNSRHIGHYVQKIENKRRCVGIYCKEKSPGRRSKSGKCDVGLYH
jgi:hypothetical protein